MRTYVLYHANCFDGIASAWAMWKKFGDGDAEYIPVAHGGSIPELEEGSQVFIVDFSYPREILDTMNDRFLLTVLDHHISAQEALKGVPYATFDINKSGAMLAWEFASPSLPAPRLVKYVQDRDLWKFELPHSQEINAYIQSFPMTLEYYEYAHRQLTKDFEGCRRQGEAIERYKTSMVEKICAEPRIMNIGGYQVPMVNATSLFAEVGSYLCTNNPDYPFAGYYYDRNDGIRQFGIYSRGDFDVSVVARYLGGGGHKGAAGFQIPVGIFMVEVPSVEERKDRDEDSKIINS